MEPEHDAIGLTMDNALSAWLLSRVRTRRKNRPRARRSEVRWRTARVARLALAAALPFVTFLCASAAPAGAAAERRASEQAARVLEQAERDDAALAFGRALAEYEEALRLDPSTASAMRAQQRAADLRARSEGAFAPLAELERVRRDPKLASDPRAIDELVRAAETFPPGLVRVEVWMLASEAFASRLDRPADAVPLWRRIVVDPHADKVVAAAAARSLVAHHLALGDLAAAEAAVALAGPHADATLASDVGRAIRRHRLHLAALGVIGLAIVLAAVAIGKAARARQLAAVIERTRTSSGLAIGYAAYVAIAGALLATGYEQGTARPFLLFGAVLVPILVVSRAWGAAGSQAAGARGLRAALCAASALGAAFLVLEHVDVAYLEGLGL